MNDRRVAAILDDVLVRRARGESVPEEDVLAAHPEFAKALSVGLARIRAIDVTRIGTSIDGNAETIIGNEDGPPANDQRKSGDRVAHYVLYKRLGEGGFGSVWLAWDEKLEFHVALKIPRRESANVELVMREARVVAGMPRHPHIVGIFAADTDGETAYIVSEYVDGVSLADWLASDLPDQYQAADLCRKIADALDHIHTAGVIHRDLKPDNVLMNASNEPGVTDFGLAVHDASIVGEIGIVGTVPYMAPEQVRCGPVDARTDVYAIGVILFELLTGQRPFRGNVNALLSKIPENDPPSPRSLVDDHPISRDLESITLKCLEKSPERRYASAADLRDDLQRFLDHTPVVARPVTVFGRLSRWCQRHPVIPLLTMTLFAGVLVLLLVAGLLLEQEVDSMQHRQQQTAQEGLMNSALTIEKLLESGLREKFRLVADAANDFTLQDRLRHARQDSVTKGQANSGVQAWFEAFDATIDQNGTSSSQEFFSWFVCNSAGFQIFRSPPNPDTLGHPFAYRSYFSARPRDGSKEQPESAAWKPGDTPRLSDVFLTEDGKAWVLAISAPVWNEDSSADDPNNRLLGVVGVFLTIRNFLDRIVPTSADGFSRFAYLLYQRDDSSEARLIGHPFQNNLVAKEPKTGRIRNEVAEVTIELKSGSGKLNPNAFCPYAPYESTAWTDKNLGKVAKELFDREWLTEHSPVDVPQSIGGPRLEVVVCEALDLVADPGKDLRRNLTYFGIAAIGLVVALLLPLWVIITRRLLV